MKAIEVEDTPEGVNGKPWPTNDKGNKAYPLVAGRTGDDFSHSYAIDGGEPGAGEGDFRAGRYPAVVRRSSWPRVTVEGFHLPLVSEVTLGSTATPLPVLTGWPSFLR